MASPLIESDIGETDLDLNTVGQSRQLLETSAEDAYFQYQKSWEKPFVHLCMAARRQMVDLFSTELKPTPETRVLDVGITTNAREDSNFFEKWYPYQDQLTCAGLDREDKIQELFPHLRYVQIPPDHLPFDDQSFDIGVSSAVIEHVGNREAQRVHTAELLRVCKTVFITTPNRRFPIEPHTMLPLMHYLPFSLWRKSLSKLGRDFYASEATLNPLNATEFRSLFSHPTRVKIEKIKLLGLATNLVAITDRPSI